MTFDKEYDDRKGKERAVNVSGGRKLGFFKEVWYVTSDHDHGIPFPLRSDTETHVCNQGSGGGGGGGGGRSYDDDDYGSRGGKGRKGGGKGSLGRFSGAFDTRKSRTINDAGHRWNHIERHSCQPSSVLIRYLRWFGGRSDPY